MTIKDNKVAGKPIATPVLHEDDPIQVTEAYLVQDENQPLIQRAAMLTSNDNPIIISPPAATAATTTSNFSREEGHVDYLYRPTFVDANSQTQSHLAVWEAPITQEMPVPAFYKAQDTVQMPSNIFIEKDALNPSAKIIRRKWRVQKGEFCYIICWNGFFLYWDVASIVYGGWGALFVGLIFTAIGFYAAFSAIREMRNSTYITMDGMNIHVDHRPIPIGSKTITFPMNQMGEVCCKKCVKRVDDGMEIHFEVHVIGNDTNRERTVLVSNLKTLEEALFIAQEIENFHSPTTGKTKQNSSTTADVVF